MIRISGSGLVCIAALAAFSAQARGSFHVMQIEQVIGGVNGDPTAQAIQLRMRTCCQNFVQFSRLVVHNATGGGNIVIATFPIEVSNDKEGARVLIASSTFAQYTNPSAAPDFIMTSLIPASYLAAGSLTFEDSGGSSVFWRVSWGGASYTGSNAGAFTNDGDGNFGPPFAGPLPSTSLQALKFNGIATAASTNNAADYSVTAGAATFNNNPGTGYNVVTPTCVSCIGDANGDLQVNGADIQRIATAYANSAAGTLGGVCTDADHDGTIEDSEIASIVDIMLGNSAPSPPCN